MAISFNYFRPEWTCGRYNTEKRVAIMYNLIEGMSYFFEDDSACVIGSLLSVERNGTISVNEVAQQTSLSVDNLLPFFNTLTNLGLITTFPINKNVIDAYRNKVSIEKRRKLASEEQTSLYKLPFKKDDAETSYLRKVGGITQAMLEVTYNCSEKCIHCYNVGATRNDEELSHRGNSNELSLDEYKDIIDQLYDAGCFKITLSGGDPFSKPIIWEIIQYIYDKGIAFDIYTNGQGLVNKIDNLIAYHPRLVSISLYADNAAIHDSITRIQGSWNRTVSVMFQLGDRAVPMDIKVCIMRTNIKAYRGVIELARKAGGMPLFEASINDSVEGDKCVSKFLRLTPEEYAIILRDDNIGLYVGKEVPYYGKQEHIVNKPICEGGREAICIDPSGNVMPCSAFHLKFGNIRDQSLQDVMNSSQTLKEWSRSTFEDTTECLTHDYCDFCVVCPGKAYAEHGDWRKPAENSCYIAKIRHKVAQDLKRGIDPLEGNTVNERLNSLPNPIIPKLHRIF